MTATLHLDCSIQLPLVGVKIRLGFHPIASLQCLSKVRTVFINHLRLYQGSATDPRLLNGTIPLTRLFWKSASIAASSGKDSTPGRGAALPASPVCMAPGRVDKENAEELTDSTKGPLRVPALKGFGLTSRLGLVSPRGGDRLPLGGERLPLLGLLFLLDLHTHLNC